jgi:peptidoglycan hydrolase-like protein with peptidoglycan-binding domain
MKTKAKVIAVLFVMVFFGLATSVPVMYAAESTTEKPAATIEKPAAPMKKTEKTMKKSAAKMSKHAAKKMHAHKAKTNAEVKMAQEALIKDGAKIKADGIFGKKTRMAVKDFQKKNNLKVNGKLDKETLAKLK